MKAKSVLTAGRHFTNRESELDLFFSSLQQRTSSFINFHGKSGIGKSWLMRSIRAKCRAEGIPVVFIDIKQYAECDFLQVVTNVRKEAPDNWFVQVGSAIEVGMSRFQTVYLSAGTARAESSAVHLGMGNSFTGSFSDVAIGGNVIKPSIVLPEPIQNHLLRQFREAVTAAFLTDLENCPEQNRLALLLDSYQAASTEFQQWIEYELLPRLADAKQSGLQIAVCHHSAMNGHDEGARVVINHEVLPFDYTATIEYIQKRAQLSRENHDLLFRLTKGHPQNLALAMDSLEGGSAP